MKGAEAIHQHHHAVSLHTTPGNSVHLCPQSCCYLVIDADGATCSKIGSRLQMGNSNVLRIISGKSLGPQPDWTRCTNGLLHGVIARCRHIQQSHFLRNVQLERTRLVRHGGDGGISMSRHTCTRYSAARQRIYHFPSDATGILRHSYP